MRFAYADPPYLGMSKHYSDHPESRVWDDPESHIQLMAALTDWFPDGWAFSLSSPSLPALLARAPEGIRVMAWVKPFASFKPNVNPAYAWEPVLVYGGRKRTRDEITVRDWVSAPITLETGLVGAKPPTFNRWVLDVLGYRDGEDEMIDLFPGTGSMASALREMRLF